MKKFTRVAEDIILSERQIKIGMMNNTSLTVGILLHNLYLKYKDVPMKFKLKAKGVPPNGRSQKQHNAVVSLNKKKRI